MTDVNNERVSKLASTFHEDYREELIIIDKLFPGSEGEGGLDPQVKKILESAEKPTARRPMDMEDLEKIRGKKEVHNSDLSSSIRVELKTVYLNDREVKIRIYNRGKTAKPGMVFYHGGGFFDVDTLVMDNLCKFLAQESKAVVVAVEYGLAPEHPYQEGIDDCLVGFRYVYEHAETLGIKRDQLGIIGDSVGGNLALGVHHLSEKEPWKISFIGLLCPLVDLSDSSRSSWNVEQYDLRKDAALIREELVAMRESLYFIQTVYLMNLKDVYLPLVSPLLRESNEGLPPTTVITAEFDFLRIQAEKFSGQLKKADVPVQHIEYKGMEHAFVRKLGYYPQAEDALLEISRHFTEAVHS